MVWKEGFTGRGRRKVKGEANQYPVDSTYPYFIAASEWESYRNRRINQVLGVDSTVSIEDVKTLHSDNYNLEAAENLTFMLAALDYNQLSGEEQAIFDKLINWNFVADADKEAPAYYNAWRDELLDLAWDELHSSEKAMRRPSAYRTFALLKNDPESNWWNIDSTATKEDAKALISYAFAQMKREIDDWHTDQGEIKLAMNWGNVKATRLTHLTRQMPLSQQNVFIGGNHGIVNATSETHGPSWRQVIEMDPKGVRAWGIYPGGQSGNPGSNWYTNYTNSWAQGEYLTLELDYLPNSTNNVMTTTFKPAAQ